MNTFFRLLFVQLVVWMILYGVSWGITLYQKEHGLQLNNAWLFNIVLLAESTILLLAATAFNRKFFTYCLVALILIGLALVIQSHLASFKSFANFSLVVFGILMLPLFVRILYQAATEQTAERKATMIFATGFLIYCAGMIPYFSLYNYLNQNDSQASKALFKSIIVILAHFRYIMLGIAFLILPKKQVAKI